MVQSSPLLAVRDGRTKTSASSDYGGRASPCGTRPTKVMRDDTPSSAPGLRVSSSSGPAPAHRSDTSGTVCATPTRCCASMFLARGDSRESRGFGRDRGQKRNARGRNRSVASAGVSRRRTMLFVGIGTSASGLPVTRASCSTSCQKWSGWAGGREWRASLSAQSMPR